MAEILAEKLEGDLDVILVHKIGAPENPEFGVGSVSEFGTIYHSKAADLCEIPAQYLEKSARQEIAKLKQKREIYTPIRPPLNPKDRTVIILDDGIATGSTMLAAIRAVRTQHPKQIIATSPVASLSAVELLLKEADEVIVLETPEEFVSVGQFYEDFPQVTDEEVCRVLSHVSMKVKSPPLKSLRNKSA
jgi:predicted phosphoribosyltransferase